MGKREFAEIAQFGSRSKSPAVKNNIKRATEIGFELLRQYTAMSKEASSFSGNEEYVHSTAAYDALIRHLESLVTQLNDENTLLKETLQKKGIEVPAAKEVPSKSGKASKKSSK